ncbi:MAG: HAD family phosphatase [Bifidobacteriaceae bacterium]|nr:HAD family phosphatase [Bifidobacteriaceae bacterium]
MQLAVNNVIFDFCGVLIDWQARACLEGAYDQVLVDKICADDDPYGFYHYEDRMDAGEDFKDLIVEYDAEYGDELTQVFTYYIEHYADALPRLMPGIVELLEDLQRNNITIWGLTNWSHETFHVAFEKYPILAQYLKDTIVSGVEKMHKPNADIYELALSRFQIRPEETVFFDDTAKNVVGAQQVGIHAFKFTTAQQARKDLQQLGINL